MIIRRKDILATIPNVDSDKIDDNDNLISQWGLTSVDIIDMVVRIEAKYHIVIDIADLLVENFESVNSIINLVKKYKK